MYACTHSPQKLYQIWFDTMIQGVLIFLQPMEVFVDDETKLTLHGLQQYYVKLKDSEKNRKLFDLLDVLEFNQVTVISSRFYSHWL